MVILVHDLLSLRFRVQSPRQERHFAWRVIHWSGLERIGTYSCCAKFLHLLLFSSSFSWFQCFVLNICTTCTNTFNHTSRQIHCFPFAEQDAMYNVWGWQVLFLLPYFCASPVSCKLGATMNKSGDGGTGLGTTHQRWYALIVMTLYPSWLR